MTSPSQNKPLTLVLGGTGKTGRRVAERLAARGLPYRLGSRSASPAFDWENPAGWPQVLMGVDAVYISYYPDLAVPGALEAIRAFSQAAKDAGVQRLVLLSGRGEPEAEACEDVVKAAGLPWTILRASFFCQNFSESFLIDAVRGGTVLLPLGDVQEPFVDADDIADIAVAALTEAGHAGQLYEITGPRLLSFAQATQEIAAALGRPISYTQIPMADYSAALKAGGVPADFVGLIGYLFTEVLDGRNSCLTEGVQRALGRPPRDFAEYARAVAASGAWNP